MPQVSPQHPATGQVRPAPAAVPAARRAGGRAEVRRRVGARLSRQDPSHPLVVHLRELALRREGAVAGGSTARCGTPFVPPPASLDVRASAAPSVAPRLAASPGSPVASPLDPRELVAGVGRLGSPPAIYSSLVAVLEHPGRGASDIAAVISEDPALSARLLRLVNSSFFAFPRHVDSIQLAVTMAGTAQIRDLVLATSVVALFGEIPGSELDMDRFWQHALACGVGARVLSSMHGEANVEASFLAGLLHDVGRLVLLQELPEAMREAMALAREEGLELQDAERRILGCDHAQVGQALVERWNLGALLEETVAFHHAPVLATRFPWQTAAVHVADVMAECAAWGHSGACVAPALAPDAWCRVGVEEHRIPPLLDCVGSQWTALVTEVLNRGSRS
jgi:HD-like signal output (HDOD) protein